MLVGLCWPSPGTEPQSLFDGGLLDLLRERTHATHLRVNFHHARGVDECLHHTRHIRAHGLELLPILDFDYGRPSLVPYAEFCAAMAREFPAVELGNEPHILHRMASDRYAQAFRFGAQAIRDAGATTRILIACEATKPIGQRIGYWDQVRRQVPAELYDGLAIHPYRNPQPPERTPFGTREMEMAFYRGQGPGKEVHVTEVGWDLRGGVDESLQAEYLGEELAIQERLGTESVYVYAYTEAESEPNFRFGITDSSLRPRPACAAIRRFQAERSGATEEGRKG